MRKIHPEELTIAEGEEEAMSDANDTIGVPRSAFMHEARCVRSEIEAVRKALCDRIAALERRLSPEDKLRDSGVFTEEQIHLMYPKPELPEKPDPGTIYFCVGDKITVGPCARYPNGATLVVSSASFVYIIPPEKPEPPKFYNRGIVCARCGESFLEPPFPTAEFEALREAWEKHCDGGDSIMGPVWVLAARAFCRAVFK